MTTTITKEILDEMERDARTNVHELVIRDGEAWEEDRDLFRLARLGLWAREKGIPAIQKVHDDEETGHWGPDRTMKSVLANALASLPEAEK